MEEVVWICVHTNFHVRMCFVSAVINNQEIAEEEETSRPTLSNFGLTCPYHRDVRQKVFPNSLEVRRLRYAGRTQRAAVLCGDSGRRKYVVHTEKLPLQMS